jgi:hypothetical protein
MKILKILSEPGDQIGAFDVQVEFTLEDNESQLEVGHWISHTFTKNFVLLEHSERIYAGGCVDNAQGWDNEWNSRGAPEKYQCVYKLRMMSEDRTIFMLKFGHNLKDNEYDY